MYLNNKYEKRKTIYLNKISDSSQQNIALEQNYQFRIEQCKQTALQPHRLTGHR